MGIKVRAPGSCGELVQGTINGKNFLITCPVNLFSEVELHPGDEAVQNAGEKVMDAVERTFAYLGLSRDKFSITVLSELPVGKGMASSSADISAACQAAALTVGKALTPDEIADIALAIEPTDGIFYPGIVAFDHVRGLIRQSLGMPPDMTIAVFDAGGQVDTVSFNRRTDLAALNAAKEEQVGEAFHLVSQGIAAMDCELIGRGATLSARANQDILYKPCLETLIEIGSRFGSVGVNAAHSGTVLGILFPAGVVPFIPACIKAVTNTCPGVTYLKTVSLVPGGLRVEGEKQHENM
jgi:L-threonine kinase